MKYVQSLFSFLIVTVATQLVTAQVTPIEHWIQLDTSDGLISNNV